MMLAKFVSQRHALGIASINAQRIAQVSSHQFHTIAEKRDANDCESENYI
jgi:hypothetical protein